MNSRSLAPPLAALILGACTEYGYTSQIQKDVFQQERRNTVDVLMVVDNSCSMWQEQEKMGENFGSFIEAFGEIDVDWQMAVVTTDTYSAEHSGRMIGGEDELELLNPSGQTLDRVAWDLGWGMQEGIALQLDPSATTLSGNDDMGNWCLATEAYGMGDLGSPGAPNGSCGLEGPQAGDTGDTGDTGGEDGGDGGDGGEESLRAPSAGEVLITEILADPGAVDDAIGEWVELTNVTADELDLTDHMIVDDGRNTFVIPAGTSIAAGASLVIGRSSDVETNGGVPAEIETGSDMTLNNAIKILTQNVEGADEIFSEMVAVGITGSGIEMGYEAAMLGLSEPLLSEENSGFLRDEANLSLIFISDENDYSPSPVNDYLRHFQGLKGTKGFRDPGVVNISAVVGKDVPGYAGLDSCESEHGNADYGVRYVDLAARTEGALESICDEDFSPIAYELGLTVSGLQVEFELSEYPDESTLEVRLYGTQDEQSLIGVLTPDEDYSYLVQKNVIRFEQGQVPVSELWIVAEYKILANGSVDIDAGTADSGERR